MASGGGRALRGWIGALAAELASQPVARRRAWVVLASVLVCAYAGGVLGYVVTTPEIGVRCAFSGCGSFSVWPGGRVGLSDTSSDE